MQGKRADDALRIVDNAVAIQEAGAIGMEVEAVPPDVGQAVEDAVDIVSDLPKFILTLTRALGSKFTFAIGAGSASCGQLLNGADLIGSFDTFKPKFAKRYGNVAEVAHHALTAFVDDVREKRFPDDEHAYKPMAAAEAEAFRQGLRAAGHAKRQ